jgi:small subunit ribosomal protein S4
VLNGKKVNVPSILVRVGDVVSAKENFRDSDKFKALLEAMQSQNAPKWLELNKENASVKVLALPQRDDIDFEFNEQLIVELYSK